MKEPRRISQRDLKPSRTAKPEHAARRAGHIGRGVTGGTECGRLGCIRVYQDVSGGT